LLPSSYITNFKKIRKNLVKSLCDNSDDVIRTSLESCGSVSRYTGCASLTLVRRQET